jgi:type II secretory pathway component PulF
MVVCFATAILFGITFTYVVPKFILLLTDLGVKELPVVTTSLLAASSGGLPVVLLLAAPPAILGVLTFGLRRGSSSPTIDRIRLRLPALGRLFESLALFRVSAMLSIFLESRVPLLDALRLAGQGADNTVVQGAVWQAVPLVAAGEPLGRALDGTGALPAAFCGQVSVAEENGDLPATLHRLSRWHAERIDAVSARMSAILEPVLILGIGAGIAWTVLGLFWPLMLIIQNLSGAN